MTFVVIGTLAMVWVLLWALDCAWWTLAWLAAAPVAALLNVPAMPLLAAAGLAAAYFAALCVVAMRTIADYARCYAALAALPLGRAFFDRVLVTLLAPAKSNTRSETRAFTDNAVELRFRQRFWLHNPFRSVDVGALVGVGEHAAGLLLIHIGRQTRRRLIPVSLRCSFPKKSRGTLTVRSGDGQTLRTRLAQESAAFDYEQHATITDASGDVCARLVVTFTISAASARTSSDKTQKKE